MSIKHIILKYKFWRYNNGAYCSYYYYKKLVDNRRNNNEILFNIFDKNDGFYDIFIYNDYDFREIVELCKDISNQELFFNQKSNMRFRLNKKFVSHHIRKMKLCV